MLEVDQSYKLIFNFNDKYKFIIDETFLEKLEKNDISNLPENTVVGEDFTFFNIMFGGTIELKLFRFPVECKFIDLDAPIKIFSSDHFKAVLEKKLTEKIYHYPYFYSEISKEIIYINMNEINNLSIHCYNYIEIKNKNIKELKEKIKIIFTNLKSIYQEKENENLSDITYNYISPNFKNYYPKLRIKLSDKFIIITGRTRIGFELKMKNFLLAKNDFIFPICGPHGTGKSITALYFHKLFYLRNIRGLYLNLKYYSQNNLSLENIIDALLYECYFICDNEEELTNLFKKFILKKNFSELIDIISEHIKLKNKEQKENINKIYIILAQYQKKYDIYNIFNTFSNIKIILLSSINDFDVKNNIILSYEEDIKKDFNNENKIEDQSQLINVIKYNYIDSFIDSNYYENDRYKELIKNKIRNDLKSKQKKIKNNINEKKNEIKKEYQCQVEEFVNNKNEKISEEKVEDKGNKNDKIIVEKEEENKKDENDEINNKKVEKEFDFVFKILKKFDFVLKYFFEYIYYYDSIFDLLFNEYSNIMKKLNVFKQKGIIDIDVLNDLINDKKIEKEENIDKAITLQKIDFLKHINYIPLKYINFKKLENGNFFLYYSFPLLKKILEEFLIYHKSKQLFYISDNGCDKGIQFERILKHNFKAYKKLELDGYFKVKTLISMVPTKKY